jgi:lipoyl(octanoyl) transferase
VAAIKPARIPYFKALLPRYSISLGHTGVKRRASIPSRDSDGAVVHLRDLGRMGYADALALQIDVVERRKRGEIPDQLLIVEHPHVITMGRNGHAENILASPEVLDRAGIELHYTDRGGDVTYHGPGQIVGYPIVDLREWKRDVGAYLRALEQALIEALADFGIIADRSPGATGVWVNGAKVAAMGVHISRWVTSHGFALNLDTDLDYFKYIVPCGLTRPVTSLRALGCDASREAVTTSVAAAFGRVFERDVRGAKMEKE